MDELQPLFDFNPPSPAPAWQAINDSVMGGCSRGHASLLPDGGMRFSGDVSLENNGGFASVRSAPGDYSLVDKENLSIKLCGDGKSYKFNLRSDLNVDGAVYQLAFTTAKNRTIELSLPLAEFRPFRHGWPQPEAGPLNLARIHSFGLLISQRQAGPFALILYSIRAV